MDPQITGENQQNVLTGQVCYAHRAVAHDAEGSDEMTFCPSCGKDDKGVQRNPGNGGWGT